MTKPVAFWLALGWVGFALLPWYLGDGFEPARSGLTHGLAGDHQRLLPLGVPLLVALVPMLARQDRAVRGAWLIVAGCSGLIWLVLEGFAIDHRGWSFEWLSDLFGTSGPTQQGMGYGAFLTMLALLMLLCHDLAWRGLCGGDAFAASALGLVIGSTALFVFFPIAKVLASAVEDNAGHLAPASFFAAFFDRSVWGLDCVHSELRCGVAWNSLFLAVVVGTGTTVL
ncbi:MAG TPA: iron ABC transporter permease, partial [Stellaceae bacterium]|nr:iron ABC transporter permease [Stellaceae bacterium]